MGKEICPLPRASAEGAARFVKCPVHGEWYVLNVEEDDPGPYHAYGQETFDYRRINTRGFWGFLDKRLMREIKEMGLED